MTGDAQATAAAGRRIVRMNPSQKTGRET